MSGNLDYKLRQRYISTQPASDNQNGMIRKLYYNLGMFDRAKHEYKHLNHYQADRLIKLLKDKTKKRKRTKKATK